MPHIRYCLTAAALTGCTVYAPVQPALPVINGAGQTELRASAQFTGRLEGNAAYSPVNHVLLLASGDWRPQYPIAGARLHRNRQIGLGLGTYWSLRPGWTVQASAGDAWAKGARTVERLGIFYGGYQYEYFARYRKPYAQLGVVYQATRAAAGMGYRYAQVRFTSLTATDPNQQAAYRLPASQQERHEPGGFVRVRLGPPQAPERWDAEVSAALSLSRRRSAVAQETAPTEQELVGFNRGAAVLLGLGITYRPR
ncbi:hypothetical protein GCM10027048_24820 [Hymenobacter coalescens]